jgi:hypothetical protein
MVPSNFPFRRVTFHICNELKCEALVALNAVPTKGLVLLSTSPTCPAPSFLVLVEKIVEFRRVGDTPAGGYFICDDDLKSAMVLLEVDFFYRMLLIHDGGNIARFLSSIWRTGELREVPEMLNLRPPFARCGAHPTCSFTKYREIDHINSIVQNADVFDIRALLRKHTATPPHHERFHPRMRTTTPEVLCMDVYVTHCG